MKKKKKKLNKKLVVVLAAVVCAFAMLKAILAPATVGKMGDVTITAGVYKMAQFQAYQTALSVATEEQAAMTTGQFLNEQIAVDENGNPVAIKEGEEQTLVTVKDFVAEETERLLRDYAIVESRFAALGGVLTEEQIAAADSYAAQVWQSYGSMYYNNGIRLKDIKAYEYNYYKAQALITLIYGTGGETPVSEEELMTLLTEEGLYGSYVLVPLYNTTTYEFATTEKITLMTERAEGIVAAYAAAGATGTEAQQAAFTDALLLGLPGVYDVLGMEYDAETSLTNELYTELLLLDDVSGAFTEANLATLTSLQPGEAAVVQYSYYGLLIFLRADPLDGHELTEYEPTLLSHLKSGELNEALETGAAEMTNGLKGYAMKAYSPRSITLY